MSGPQIASNSTESHMTQIARDAHISGTWSCNDHGRFSGTTPDGLCEIVDISHLLPPYTLANGISQDIGGGADLDA